MAKIRGISVREKIRLARVAKRAEKEKEKATHMALYFAWFTTGLSLKVDQRSFTSTEMIAWGKKAGFTTMETINKGKLAIRTFGFVRAINPNSKDGRHWKKGKTYMLYVKSEAIAPEKGNRPSPSTAQPKIMVEKATTPIPPVVAEEQKPFKPSWKL